MLHVPQQILKYTNDDIVPHFNYLTLLLKLLRPSFYPKKLRNLGEPSCTRTWKSIPRLAWSTRLHFLIETPDRCPQVSAAGRSFWLILPGYVTNNLSTLRPTRPSSISSESGISLLVKDNYQGTNPDVDSYSAFFDNQKLSKTSLEDIIKKEDVTDIYVCGIATDVCVGEYGKGLSHFWPCSSLWSASTAFHGLEQGFRTILVQDASRGIKVVNRRLHTSYKVFTLFTRVGRWHQQGFWKDPRATWCCGQLKRGDIGDQDRAVGFDSRVTQMKMKPLVLIQELLRWRWSWWIWFKSLKSGQSNGPRERQKAWAGLQNGSSL